MKQAPHPLIHSFCDVPADGAPDDVFTGDEFNHPAISVHFTRDGRDFLGIVMFDSVRDLHRWWNDEETGGLDGDLGDVFGDLDSVNDVALCYTTEDLEASGLTRNADGDLVV